MDFLDAGLRIPCLDLGLGPGVRGSGFRLLYTTPTTLPTHSLTRLRSKGLRVRNGMVGFAHVGFGVKGLRLWGGYSFCDRDWCYLNTAQNHRPADAQPSL